MSPRPRQSTGRPATPVIPAGWEPGHAQVVAGTLRGTVTLRDPADVTEEWNPVTQQNETIPAAPYATGVPARVQRLSAQARDVVAAEVSEVVVDHLVVVPWDRTDVRTGHRVTVTAATDPQLVGLALTVQYVAVGTERFSRDLFCTLT